MNFCIGTKPTQDQVRKTRLQQRISCLRASELVGVTEMTWRRWEGQTASASHMPVAAWELWLLAIGRHPRYTLTER